MKATFVEFVGLPGSGKTTVVELVLKKVKKLGYKVASDEEIYDTNLVNSGINLFFSLASPYNYTYNFTLMKILLKGFDGSKINWVFRRYLKLVKLNGKIKWAQKKYDFIILSEGYLQVFSSLFDDGDLNRDVIREYGNMILFKHWRCIEIFVPVELACDRIVNRKDLSDEWFLLSDIEKKRRLYIRQEHIRKIAQEIDVLKLDGNCLPEMLTAQVINFMEKEYE